MCADVEVSKLPSAPRLNLSGAREAEAAKPEAKAETEQSIFMRAVRHVLENTEDVGERFPEEARRIHYGEIDARGIRGRASKEETEALLEEGIDVMPLPIPAALKEPLQ